ncbi:MAG: phosphatase PAP2 family protein, partial [Frankia sp.]|nr:phosphatase PAP2 family protein [Frankia sp.]
WVGLVKLAVGRDRPADVEPLGSAFGFAYPSGHALGVLVAAGAGALVVRGWTGRAPGWRYWLPAGAAVGLCGLSRIALGVHYPSDVVGGYLLGGAWVLGVTLAASRLARPPRVTRADSARTGTRASADAR